MSFKPPPRKMTGLDNPRLWLQAESPTGSWKKPACGWTMVNNKCWLTVFTNDENDDIDHGRIIAKLDLSDALAFISLIEQVAKGPEDNRYHIEIKDFTYKGGKRSEAMTTVCKLYTGKDQNGMIWISVIAEGRPKIKFFFDFDDRRHAYKADGSRIEIGESSMLLAKTYIENMRIMLPMVYNQEYKHPEKKDKDGGSNNRGGGSNHDTSDDDIPF